MTYYAIFASHNGKSDNATVNDHRGKMEKENVNS